jgi:hypothetical protein
MSTPSYSAIPAPSYTFGNMQDVHAQLVANLVTETTDPTNSNFCLLNNSSGQIITTPLQLNPVDGDPDDNTTNAYNNNRVATRKWCKNAYITNIMDPHIQSSDYTFTGTHVHSADLRVTNDPTLPNSVTRKSYVDSGDSAATTSAIATMRAGTNAWTGSNTFNSTLPTSTLTPSSNTQLITKVFADTTYQAKLSGSSTLAVGNFTSSSFTDTGSATFINGLTVSAGTISVPAGSISDASLASTFVKPSTAPALTGTNITGIPESAVTNLTSDLAAKQATIGSTTDLAFRDLTATGVVTIPSSSITDANLVSTFVKPSTAPPLTGTNFTGIPESAVTNLTSDLAGKQATLTTGSVTDAMLASTFVKPSTAPVLTGTNITGIPESAVTNLTSDLAGKQATLTNGSVTDSMLASTFLKTTGGKVTNLCESLATVTTNSANNYTINYSTSGVAYLSTAPTANFTLALYNSAATTSNTSVYSLVFTNTNKVYPTTLNIYSDAGSTSISCTTVWLGGTPSISSATVSVLTISVMKALSSNYAMCSISNYY